MTNRRRSGKGRTSVSKKAESPDKQARKLTRRSRRSKKSESPEVTQEVDTDYSGDEVVEERENRKLDGEKNESVESIKSNEDQRSQTREEESGGSDGSWKVKSENGGGGGIPKLKLCLTRPQEMSSPTSVEQQPSPRKRRRGGRGNATPTKEEDHSEENVVEECSKRVTRNQRAKNLSETEVISEGKSAAAPVSEGLPKPEVKLESKSDVQPEPDSQTALPPIPVEVKAKTPEPEQKSQFEPEQKLQQDLEIQSKKEETHKINNSRCVEEDETRMAVESICGVKQSEDSGSCGPTEEVKFHQALKEEVEKPISLLTEESNELKKEQSNEKKLDKKIDNLESQQAKSKSTTGQSQSEAQSVSELQNDSDSSYKTFELLPLQEAKAELVTEARRSSSRDSSEERAKEAALRSRNKNKKRDEEIKNDITRRTRSDVPANKGSEKSEEKEYSASKMDKIDTKQENVEEPMAAKSSGARKRRWGSSTNNNSKKQSVSISTDFLKEIIPEAKPLLMSEVQLSPNNEDEEGQVKESEDKMPLVVKKPEREKIVQSDESEKDYEEEVGESVGDDTVQPEPAKPPLPPPHKEKELSATFTRKVSVLSSNEKLQKSPSPPRHKPSNIIYIVNLVRPFTIPQLRELLARTGTIVEDGFWIDKIKSKCYVKYETEEEAKTTRHALHGVRWPVSNPKQLIVDFGTETAMKAAIEGNEVATKRSIPSLFEKQIDLKSGDFVREREKDNNKATDKRERLEKDKKERGKYRDEEKRGDEEEEEKKSRPAVEPLVRDRTVRRVTMPIREWDVGKNEDGFSPPPECVEFSRHRNDRYERRVEYDRDKKDDYEERRRREKDRNRRSVSGEPPRKSKKKEEETPAKLLDDLFRKTKATPCIYWLPLTPEQISVKEEMRRKHMAEHEKKVAEMRKMQREQGKRSSDKRRRRTKSRSRSRSVKK